MTLYANKASNFYQIWMRIQTYFTAKWMLHFRMGSTNTVKVISPGMTIFLYAANPWAIELKFDQIRSIVNNEHDECRIYIYFISKY